MAFIKLFKFQESTGLLKKEYEKGLRRAGRIWNILTIQSQTPEILKNSMNLYGSTTVSYTHLTLPTNDLV